MFQNNSKYVFECINSGVRYFPILLIFHEIFILFQVSMALSMSGLLSLLSFIILSVPYNSLVAASARRNRVLDCNKINEH